MARLYCQTLPNSFVAIMDCIILGSYTGVCTSEWCNDHIVFFATIGDLHWGDYPNALPVISNNFGFCIASRHHLSDILTTNNDDLIFTTLCILKQKTMTTDKC